MPNGGVPLRMVLYPKDASLYVFYLEGGKLRLYDRDTWDREQAKGHVLTELNEAEAASVAWFLRHWLGEESLRPGFQMPGAVNAEFDY